MGNSNSFTKAKVFEVTSFFIFPILDITIIIETLRSGLKGGIIQMEEQTELNKGIGTITPEKKEVLKPTKVKIVKVSLRDTKKGKIVNCESKHPDKEENINISSLAYLRDKQITNGGLWFTLDKEGNIQQGSALAIFMEKLQAKTLNELVDKEPDTELDDKNWLCFKSY